MLRIDPRSGRQTVLADLNPGLDNLTFVDDRLFVSNFTGEITEILAGGMTQTVLPGGLNWPLDLAVGPDGILYIADGTYFYLLLPDHTLHTVGMLFTPGYPGFLRGLTPSGPGSSSSPRPVVRYRGIGRPAAKAKSWQMDSISSTVWRSHRTVRSRPPNSGPAG